MGDVELNIYQRTILFLLMPIILPTVAGFYAVGKLRDGITALLPTNQTDSDDLPQDSANNARFYKLYKYATQGDTTKFRKILANLAQDRNGLVEILSLKSPSKNTFLHIAAARGDEALALAILDIHSSLMFEQNKEGDSPLHVAAKVGNKKLVEALVAKGVQIRNPSADVELGEEELATNTAENGYEFLLNMRNNQGNTALHEALITGQTSVAQFLVETDPIVTNFFEMVNKENKSPLYLAVEGGYVEVVNSIKVKANDLEDRVCRGRSPVLGSILSRSKEMVELLPSMRLNIVNSEGEEGKTPLHYAVSTEYLDGVRILLGQSTTDAYQSDMSGVFPIHTAAAKGYVEIIKEFLQCCPDTWELQNSRGQNILHVAAKCGRENVVKYVLKNRLLGKLINEKDNNGDTPLHLAAKYKHPLVISTLTWDKRTSLKLVNNDSFTALDIAEGNVDNIASFHGRLSWIALKSGRAKRAQKLHVLLRKKEQAPSQIPLPNGQFPNLDDLLGLKLPIAGAKLPHFESFKDRANTLLLVTTLIATVTFAAGFTMPGGYNSSHTNQGMATMIREVAFQIFVICDTMAMYCSIMVAVSLIWAQLGDMNLVLSALRLALPMLGVALTMMSVAFTAGIYVVVSDLQWLAGAILGLGGLFVTMILLLFIPLFFPSQSPNRIVRYITYYPFRLAVCASGNYNKELEE